MARAKPVAITDPADRAYLLMSLTCVGPRKAIGYLPMRTVTRILSVDPAALIATARARGVCALVFTARDCCIGGGALYFYDPAALGTLLDASADVLADAGVPTEPEPFVRHIARRWYGSDHPLRAIIDHAFADRAMADAPIPGRAREP